MIDSKYRDALSRAIIRLQVRGVLNQLKDKWWRQKRDGEQCSRHSNIKSYALRQLDISAFVGTFLVLSAGISFAFVLVIIENIFKKVRSKDTSVYNLVISPKISFSFLL